MSFADPAVPDPHAFRSARGGRTGRRGTAAAADPAAVGFGKLPLLPAALVIAVIVPIYFAIGPIALNGHRVLLLLIFVPLLFKLFAGAAGPMRTVDGMVIAHTVWSALAIAINNPNEVIQFSGSTSVEFLGGYLIGRICVRDAAQFKAFIRFFALIVVATLPLALLEARTGNSLALQMLDLLPATDSLRQVAAAPRMGLERVQFTFPTPIHYGLFGALCFSLVVIGLSAEWSRGKRLVVGALIFLSSFLSLSAGAFLALIFQLGLIVWATMFASNENRWKILMWLFAVFYIVVEVFSDRSAFKVLLTYATFSAATAYNRILIFEYGMQNVLANPIFGIGLAQWERPIWLGASVDNFWMVLGMRHGIPAFAFLAVAWIGSMWKIAVWQPARDTSLWFLRRAWLFMMYGLTFSLSTVHVWGGVMAMVMCIMASGLWMLDEAERAAPRPAAGRQGRRAKPAPRAATEEATGAVTEAGDGRDAGAGESPARGPRYTRFPVRPPE